MNYVAARQAGVAFFTHKCTDGPRYYRDPYFGRAMSGAKSAGIPLLGAYHVLWNGNVVSQMDWFMSILDTDAPGWRSGGFLLQLDCEPFSYNGGAPSAASIRQAADYLKAKTGYTPLIYAPRWVYGDTLVGLPYPLWASNYGKNIAGTVTALAANISASQWAAYSGQTPAVLQFGSRAVIGTQPTCDINAYRGTLADLRALIGGRSTESAAIIEEDDDDMAGGIPPTEIPRSGGGSYTIWPVNAGAAGHGPAWVNIGNDTNGAKYAVRVWGSRGDRNFFPVGSTTDGVVTLDSGQIWGVSLPDGTRILAVGRMPAGGAIYDGHLTFCVEYGKRA